MGNACRLLIFGNAHIPLSCHYFWNLYIIFKKVHIEFKKYPVSCRLFYFIFFLSLSSMWCMSILRNSHIAVSNLKVESPLPSCCLIGDYFLPCQPFLHFLLSRYTYTAHLLMWHVSVQQSNLRTLFTIFCYLCFHNDPFPGINNCFYALPLLFLHERNIFVYAFLLYSQEDVFLCRF